MWQVSRITYPVARKEYQCEAVPWLDWADFYTFDIEDLVILKKIEDEDYKILKGTKYMHIRGLWEGEWCTYRTRLDTNDLCIKYDLYPE